MSTAALVPSLSPGGGSAATVRTVALVGGVGLAGWLAYEYWYKPAKMRADIQAAMALRGAPGGNPLAVLGSAACQAYGAKYGIPPQGSIGICGELAGAAAQLVQQLPQLINGTGMALGNTVGYLGAGAGSALDSIGGGLGSGVSQLGTGVGGAVSGLSSGVASGAVAIGSVPIKIIGNTVTPIYNGAKTVVKDVAGAVGKVGSSIGHALSSIF